MKIVSFTMVNNESEIIESFIRYNYNFVDHMVIIDNGCTDNTIEIVNQLISENYQITVYDESLEAYNQFRLDNKYLHKIIMEMNPDIILPLDADEFLIADGNPRDLLETLKLDRVYYVNWQWYVMTKEDDIEEAFIPRKMQYCLKEPVWNYSDGTPVTKTIIPAQYFDKMRLTLSMGHHTVFGNSDVKVETRSDIRFAHYRAISEEQLIYKTCCYTMRDIATMENNSETAQRTNQMSLIEKGVNMWDTAVEASYAGYPKDIVKKPIDLMFCTKSEPIVKYTKLAKESITTRVMLTGREMAIRVYNIERLKKNKSILSPVLFILDGVKETDVILPNPSNKLTIYTAMFNVQGFITFYNEIKFLKSNYRLIITPDQLKFLPHKYIVIPDTLNLDDTRKKLKSKGVDMSKVVTLAEYKKKIGFIGVLYSYLMVVPGMITRVREYVTRNGIRTTISKIRQRIGFRG